MRVYILEINLDPPDAIREFQGQGAFDIISDCVDQAFTVLDVIVGADLELHDVALNSLVVP